MCSEEVAFGGREKTVLARDLAPGPLVFWDFRIGFHTVSMPGSQEHGLLRHFVPRNDNVIS